MTNIDLEEDSSFEIIESNDKDESDLEGDIMETFGQMTKIDL